MIRSTVALEAILRQGRTVARLAEMGGARWRWVMTDTNEPVHAVAIKKLVWQGALRVVATDICGDPMQLGVADAAPSGASPRQVVGTVPG
jgi:hypothetical protein